MNIHQNIRDCAAALPSAIMTDKSEALRLAAVINNNLAIIDKQNENFSLDKMREAMSKSVWTPHNSLGELSKQEIILIERFRKEMERKKMDDRFPRKWKIKNWRK